MPPINDYKMPICFIGGVRIEKDEVLDLLRDNGVESLFMPCWKTMVKIPTEIVEKASELGERLGEGYDDFSFKIITSYKQDIRDEQKCELMVVYSPTNDLAYVRGNKIMYSLNLKECPRIKMPYYWVKEYPSDLHAGEGADIHISSEGEELINQVRGCLANSQ